MAKIKVMSAGAVEGPVTELAAEFTRASGHEVDLHFNTVGAHKDKIHRRGEDRRDHPIVPGDRSAR